MKISHLILTFFIIANISLSSVRADILDDLFAENQAAKKSIISLQMDCKELTVQCKERATALQSSDSFSKNFEEALQRNIHEWPNNELAIIKEALNLRKFADNRFKKGFFGQASEQYDKATKMISDVLVEANQLFEDNLRVGEKYLYEKDKPEWAITYFNTALKYAPEDERVRRGIDVINFRRNYEKDIAESEKRIAIGDDAEAIFLLEKLLSGSPDEKRMEIQKLLAKAKANLKIKEVEKYAQEFNDDYENGEDKIQILSKIENALATYGEDSTTLTLQKLKDKITEETYAQSFQDLQEAFINKTKEIEELYILASSLEKKYPSKGDLRDLYDEITEQRNDKLFKQKTSEAQDLIKIENWNEAAQLLDQALDLKVTDETVSQSEKINAIALFLQDAEDIIKNSFKRLDTLNKTSTIRKQIENIKNYSNNIETPKLDEKISKLEEKISSYESLIAEEEKSKTSSRRTSNRRNSSSSKSESSSSSSLSSSEKGLGQLKLTINNNATTASNNNETSTNTNTQTNAVTKTKPKLDMNSFQKAISCKSRTRNKKMSVVFSIIVSSSGKALSVEPVNASEFKSSAEKEVIKILKAALLKSKYKPGSRNQLNIDTSFEKKVIAPDRLCRD